MLFTPLCLTTNLSIAVFSNIALLIQNLQQMKLKKNPQLEKSIYQQLLNQQVAYSFLAIQVSFIRNKILLRTTVLFIGLKVLFQNGNTKNRSYILIYTKAFMITCQIFNSNRINLKKRNELHIANAVKMSESDWNL